MEKPILSVKNLSYQVHSVNQSTNILKNVSFDLFNSELLGIVGPNGGGKSTLLKIILGLIKPTTGEINSESKNTGHVFQSSELNVTLPLTVGDVISLNQKPNSLKLSEVLTLVGLSDKKDYLIRNLSGGEKQRTLIGRSIINKPALLILDEPTTALDGEGLDLLYKIILKLKDEYKTAIIMVDHNLPTLIKNCDKVLCLNKSLHWHDLKTNLSPKTLNHIYHCEFEHLLIHDHDGIDVTHEHCHHDDHNHQFIRPKHK